MMKPSLGLNKSGPNLKKNLLHKNSKNSIKNEFDDCSLANLDSQIDPIRL
jgi:hypothetical protein